MFDLEVTTSSSVERGVLYGTVHYQLASVTGRRYKKRRCQLTKASVPS